MTNHIVLYQPQIPANTGNIARTCAGTDSVLHLIKPLGFKTDDKHLKRAGLDYWNKLEIQTHDNLSAFLETVDNHKLYLITKFADQIYSDADLSLSKDSEDIYFMFGRETSGLPEEFMRKNEEKCIRIPMDDRHVRSLNLSNAAAIIIYEALRQQNFPLMDLTYHYENDKLD